MDFIPGARESHSIIMVPFKELFATVSLLTTPLLSPSLINIYPTHTHCVCFCIDVKKKKKSICNHIQTSSHQSRIKVFNKDKCKTLVKLCSLLTSLFMDILGFFCGYLVGKTVMRLSSCGRRWSHDIRPGVWQYVRLETYYCWKTFVN